MSATSSETIHRNHFYILVLSTIAAIAGLLFGFDTGVISGALQFIVDTFHIIAPTATLAPTYSVFGLFGVNGTTIQEVIVSAVPAGALIGAILSSFLSNAFGRRGGIITTAVLFIIGTLFAATAINTDMLIIGRLIMGFAVGLSATIAPMYLSEVSPPDIRGMVVFLFQMAITVGILSAFIVNFLFHINGNWRAMFLVGLAPSVLLFVGMLFLPESPRWLVLKGKHEKAHHALHKLRGHEAVSGEVAEIKESIRNAKGNFRMLFSKRLRPLVFITFGLFVFQQFTGINTIFYYAPTLFKAAGFEGSTSQILALVSTGAINVFATIFGVWFIDRLGRRKLLYVGLVGIILCQLIMGAAYHQLLGTNIRWLTLFSSLALIVFFAFSMGGIPYIMMSELFPLNMRAGGMAVASCANWGFNILVSATFLTIVDVFGFGNAYWLYAFLTFLGLVFAISLIPETKNRTLEHIEKNLYAGKKPRDLGN